MATVSVGSYESFGHLSLRGIVKFRWIRYDSSTMKTIDKTLILSVEGGFVNLPRNPKEEEDNYV
jgi:hypothetical protein